LRTRLSAAKKRKITITIFIAVERTTQPLLAYFRRAAIETGFGNQHESGGHRGGRRRLFRVQDRREPDSVQSGLEAQRKLFPSFA